MKTHKLPPVISTYKTPQDILGAAYQAYVDFVANHHSPPVKQRKMDDADRARGMQMYKRLAEHGFYLVVNKSGPDLIWSFRAKSEVDVLFESGLSGEHTNPAEVKRKTLSYIKNLNG